MAPVKFDDIPKVATEILKDNYQTSGHTLKAKQKTTWTDAQLSTQVDLFGDKCATPAKLTWKFPKPLGLSHVVIDKLELDKNGNYKLEASTDKVYPGLKVELKSDLANPNSIVTGCTYTGISNTQAKFECKAKKPQDFSGELTYQHCIFTGGLKFNKSILNGGLPECGFRVASGPVFCSLLAKDKFSKFDVATMYKVHEDIKCAASLSYGLKDKVQNGTVGLSYKGLYKAKVSQDRSVCLSVKHRLAKGFSVVAGVKHDLKGCSYGLELSVE